jgi:hypothetical protein
MVVSFMGATDEQAQVFTIYFPMINTALTVVLDYLTQVMANSFEDLLSQRNQLKLVGLASIILYLMIGM